MIKVIRTMVMRESILETSGATDLIALNATTKGEWVIGNARRIVAESNAQKGDTNIKP